jgi:hypothetical protein
VNSSIQDPGPALNPRVGFLLRPIVSAMSLVLRLIVFIVPVGRTHRTGWKSFPRYFVVARPGDVQPPPMLSSPNVKMTKPNGANSAQ